MLQTIREHTQGWIAAIIISIIILTFALWGIHSYFIGGTNNRIVAEVNGVEITKEQLTLAFERLRRQIQLQYGVNNPFASKNDSLIKDRALKGLVEIEVLKQAAFDQGFRISNPQIDSYLQSMPEFQVNGQFSLERFQDILSRMMISTSEFLDLVKTSLVVNQPKLGVIFTSFVLPQETFNVIGLVNQDRDIAYVTIPFQYFLSQPFQIPNEKIQAYYNEHQQEFMTPEQVQVNYVELSLKDIIPTINADEETLKNYYNENSNSFSQPMAWKLMDIQIPILSNASPEEVAKAQKKVEEVTAAIKKGSDFAKLSKGYTENLSSKGWLTLNQVPEELQKAVSSLAEANQVSEPIQTSKGIVILKAIAIQPPKVLPYNEVKTKVKETYVRQKAEEKLQDLRDQLANITYEHPDSLDYAAKNLNLTIKTSEMFTKETPGKDIAQHQKIREAAFSNDVLNLQNNSDVIQISPDTLAVIRVNTHVPAKLQPLTLISKQIEDKLKNKEADARAAKLATEIKNKLMAGETLQQVTTSYKFTPNQAGYIGRYSNKVDPAILDMAFRLPHPQNSKLAYGIARLPNGYAVIVLKGVKEGSADKKQFSVFAEQVQNSEGLLEYELYKQSLMKQAKIKYEQ